MKKYITTIILISSFTGFVTYATIKTKADETLTTVINPKNEESQEFKVTSNDDTLIPIKNGPQKPSAAKVNPEIDTTITVSPTPVIETQNEQILTPKKESIKTDSEDNYEDFENEEYDD